jgi:hypothetical protein
MLQALMVKLDPTKEPYMKFQIQLVASAKPAMLSQKLLSLCSRPTKSRSIR